MDPDETLRRLRIFTENIGLLAPGEAEGALAEMVELFDGLDGWLSRGGFPPKDWSMRTRRG